MRKFYVNPMLNGFWGGVWNGMASSNHAFEAPQMVIHRDEFYGMKADKEAIAADVRRADKQLKRIVAAKRQYSAAS